MKPYLVDEEQNVDPFDQGAASMPTIIGGGCLARFDPDELNEESGADFSALWPSDVISVDPD